MTKGLAAVLAAIVISGSAWGAQPQADPPLVVNGDVALTANDFEAYLEKVPAKLRTDFRADLERVRKTVDGLWVQRMVAQRARAAGLANDPLVAARIAQAQETVLVEAYMLQIEKDMKFPDLVPRAREVYRATQDNFKVPGRIHVQHILVDVKCRNRDDAVKRAKEIHAEVTSGKEEFTAYAKRFSDDPSKEKNGGDLGLMQQSAFDEQFRTAVAKMAKPGEVSEPIETRFGFHIVRLVKREPDRVKSFDEVKDDLIALEKQKMVDEARTQVVLAVRADPKTYLHLENVESLATKSASSDTAPKSKTN